MQSALVGDVLIECRSESLNRISGRYLVGFDKDFCGSTGGCGGGSCRSFRAGFAGVIFLRGHRRNIELPEDLDRYSNVEAAV